MINEVWSALVAVTLCNVTNPDECKIAIYDYISETPFVANMWGPDSDEDHQSVCADLKVMTYDSVKTNVIDNEDMRKNGMRMTVKDMTCFFNVIPITSDKVTEKLESK